MIGSLQLKYNRGRQAVITNELIDIITVSLLAPLNLVGGCVELTWLGCFGLVIVHGSSE